MGSIGQTNCVNTLVSSWGLGKLLTALALVFQKTGVASGGWALVEDRYSIPVMAILSSNWVVQLRHPIGTFACVTVLLVDGSLTRTGHTG